MSVRRCTTCQIPLWFSWLIQGWPWKKRIRKYRDATNCIHCLPYDWDKKGFK